MLASRLAAHHPGLLVHLFTRPLLIQLQQTSATASRGFLAQSSAGTLPGAAALRPRNARQGQHPGRHRAARQGSAPGAEIATPLPSTATRRRSASRIARLKAPDPLQSAQGVEAPSRPLGHRARHRPRHRAGGRGHRGRRGRWRVPPGWSGSVAAVPDHSRRMAGSASGTPVTGDRIQASSLPTDSPIAAGTNLTRAPGCEDQLGLADRLQFGAQPWRCDIHHTGVHMTLPGIAPDLFEDLAAAERLARAADEQPKQAVPWPVRRWRSVVAVHPGVCFGCRCRRSPEPRINPGVGIPTTALWSSGAARSGCGASSALG